MLNISRPYPCHPPTADCTPASYTQLPYPGASIGQTNIRVTIPFRVSPPSWNQVSLGDKPVNDLLVYDVDR